MSHTTRDQIAAITDEAVETLQYLLRLDTTNPPGNETLGAQYIADVLRREGYDPVVIESAPGRGNVVARYGGTGESDPLLLYGHIDVVTADPHYWSHGPFSGDIADGCVWGRGALDMKGMVAQELVLMILLKRSGIRLERDVIFAATADEESGGQAGMGFLVEHHPELIRAAYGLSEGGGTTTYLAGKPYYDIRVSEKGTCRFHLRAHGVPGHGSIPRPQTAVSLVAEAVTALVNTPLPFRWTESLDAYFTFLCESLNVPPRNRHPDEENVTRLIAMLPPALGEYVHAITHDTAVPTGLRAGQKINVIPGVAEAWVDGRYLPGQTPEGFFEEIRAVLGDEYEIEPTDRSDPVQDDASGPLYETILAVMKDHAPGVPVVPMMMTGATDAKHVSRLGTRCLGFGPTLVRDTFPADQLPHAHNERIPIDGYMWGVHVLHDIVTQFCSEKA